MPDWGFYVIGILEAAAIVGMLVLVSRYDRDHPESPPPPLADAAAEKVLPC